MKKWRWLWVLMLLGLLGLLSILAMVLGLVFGLPALVFSDQPVQLGPGSAEDPTPIREALVQSLRETGEGRITARQLNAIFPQNEDIQCAFDLSGNWMEVRCSVMLDDEDEADGPWVSTSWRGRLEVQGGMCTVLDNDRVTVGSLPVTPFFREFGVAQCQQIWSDPENAEFVSKVDAFYVEDGVLVIRVSEAGRAEIRGPQDVPAAAPPTESGSD